MAKYKPNHIRYKYPLPIHPIDQDSLPTLVVHNPVSWVYWLYKYCSLTNKLNRRIDVQFNGGGNYKHITVSDAADMLYLWDNGFFGTGTLSRSEPTWLNRTEKRLREKKEEEEEEEEAASASATANSATTNANVTSAFPELTQGGEITLEKVTEIRRLQRLEFKKERERLERELLEFRKSGKGTIQEEHILVEQQREWLRNFKEGQRLKELDGGMKDVQDIKPRVRIEDEELYDNDDNDIADGKIIALEKLELMPVEATFLTFALPVLNITTAELFDNIFCRTSQEEEGERISYGAIHRFIVNYVVYHHYRSRGWCARSGIKFGCDYLLYKRGPPFQHAEFCVVVRDCTDDHGQNNDYTFYSSISRVASTAKKTLILSYVERLCSEDKIMQLWQGQEYAKVFASYRVGEIIYRRWVPGRNRD